MKNTLAILALALLFTSPSAAMADEKGGFFKKLISGDYSGDDSTRDSDDSHRGSGSYSEREHSDRNDNDHDSGDDNGSDDSNDDNDNSDHDSNDHDRGDDD
ncbi:hypothetical protein [Roseibium sp.]|uniref:hypothetical protein n=1 Tax=Roseibium sp. TaxID=1936156 RepID=UPI003D0D68C9